MSDEDDEPETKGDSLRSIESVSTLDDVDKHKNVIKKKIMFVAKMLKLQRILKTENETLLKIKSIFNNKLPSGLLTDGRSVIETFKTIKLQDLGNESRPRSREML